MGCCSSSSKRDSLHQHSQNQLIDSDGKEQNVAGEAKLAPAHDSKQDNNSSEEKITEKDSNDRFNRIRKNRTRSEVDILNKLKKEKGDKADIKGPQAKSNSLLVSGYGLRAVTPSLTATDLDVSLLEASDQINKVLKIFMRHSEIIDLSYLTQGMQILSSGDILLDSVHSSPRQASPSPHAPHSPQSQDSKSGDNNSSGIIGNGFLHPRTKSVSRFLRQSVSEVEEQRLRLKSLCYALEDLRVDWQMSAVSSFFKDVDIDHLNSLSYYQYLYTLHYFDPRFNFFWLALMETDPDEASSILPFKEYNPRGMAQLQTCLDILATIYLENDSNELNSNRKNGKYKMVHQGSTSNLSINNENDTDYTIDDQIYCSFMIVRHLLQVQGKGFVDSYLETLKTLYFKMIESNEPQMQFFACVTFGQLIFSHADSFLDHGCEILDKLFSILASTNTAVQHAAHHCCRIVALFCQDKNDDMINKIIKNIDKTVGKPIRQTCLKCLTVILESPDFARRGDSDPVWKKIEQAVSNIVSDESDAEEVKEAAALMVEIEKSSKLLASKLEHRVSQDVHDKVEILKKQAAEKLSTINTEDSSSSDGIRTPPPMDEYNDVMEADLIASTPISENDDTIEAGLLDANSNTNGNGNGNGKKDVKRITGIRITADDGTQKHINTTDTPLSNGKHVSSDTPTADVNTIRLEKEEKSFRRKLFKIIKINYDDSDSGYLEDEEIEALLKDLKHFDYRTLYRQCMESLDATNSGQVQNIIFVDWYMNNVFSRNNNASRSKGKGKTTSLTLTAMRAPVKGQKSRNSGKSDLGTLAENQSGIAMKEEDNEDKKSDDNGNDNGGDGDNDHARKKSWADDIMGSVHDEAQAQIDETKQKQKQAQLAKLTSSMSMEARLAVTGPDGAVLAANDGSSNGKSGDKIMKARTMMTGAGGGDDVGAGSDSESQSSSSKKRGKRNSASFQGAYLLTRVNTSPLFRGMNESTDLEARRTRAKRKSAALQKKQIDIILDLFGNNDGQIAVFDLPDIWNSLPNETKGRSIDDAKKELDPENTGFIKKSKLSKWWYKIQKKETRIQTKFQAMLATISDDDIRQAFDNVDKGKSGQITFAEFCYALEDLHIRWGIDEAKAIFKKLDEKKNKRIDFQEFKAGLFEVNGDQMEAFWMRILGKDNRKDSIHGQEDLRTEVNMTEEKQMSLDEILGKVDNAKTDWKERLVALQQLSLHFTASSMDAETFHKEMERFKEPLALQVAERRSAVCRDACKALAEIAQVRREQMQPYFIFFMEHLFTIVRVNIKIMSNSAHQCCKVLVSSVPENADHIIISSLETGVKSKFAYVRECCFEYLSQILEVLEAENDEAYMVKIEALITKGIQDADGKVRSKAFQTLALLSMVDQSRTEKIFDTMSNAAKKRYEKQFSKPDSKGGKGGKGGNDEKKTKKKKQRQRIKRPKGTKKVSDASDVSPDVSPDPSPNASADESNDIKE